MPGFSNTQKKYLEVAQFFHWATRDHYNIWLYGSTDRNYRTEAILPRLAKRYANRNQRRHSLFATQYGKRMVYTCPRRIRNTDRIQKIGHGLGVTECLVRFWRANMETTVIDERFFYRLGSVPDVGFQYHKGNLLLVEYCSKSNFEQYSVIKNKIAAYKRNLWQIEEKFGGKGIIVFVIDVPQDVLQRFIWEVMPTGLPAFFTDFETFKNVPIGEQLSASIYLWGEDGKTYPLTQDA